MRSTGRLRLLPALALTAAALAPSQARGDVEPHGGLLRSPDVSAVHIVFVYADDLWLVSRDGGQATPLASPAGVEGFPRFSADGRTIAFTGNYDGNPDLYTVSVEGGVPHRVTHHPSAELTCDWTPDGRLLFGSSGFSGQGLTRLFTVAPEGGLPEAIGLPWADRGAISPDGRWLAYTPLNRDTRTWKRYMGGLASDIWLLNLQDQSSRKITDWGGTDTQPMWHGDTVYYLSDAGPRHRLNVWAFELGTDERRQVTFFAEYDVKWPSIGPGPDGRGEIVFQNGAKLHLLNLANGSTRPVDVSIPGAKPSIREQSVDASELISSWSISPNGKRAVVEARGDVWTLPAKEGTSRNLTRTSGVAERLPEWSPDGRWIAYFTDAGGNYELAVMQSDGKGEPRVLTEGNEEFFLSASWSPDSEHIAFTDQTGKLHLYTMESKERRLVAESPFGGFGGGLGASWSHDSAWLAFSNSAEDNQQGMIWLYRLEDSSAHKVTGGMFNDDNPVFGRKGDYLFFASSRNFQPSYSDLDSTFIYDQSQVLVAVPLRADVASPYLPKSDEEEFEAESDEPAEEEGAEAGEAEAAKPADAISGTWAGVLEGQAPMPEGPQAFILVLVYGDDSQLTGTFSTPGGSGPLKFGVYTADNQTIAFTVVTAEGQTWVVTGTIAGDEFTGTAYAADMGVNAKLKARRMELPEAAAKSAEAKAAEDAEEEPEGEALAIDLEGFESRAMQLPVPPGNFGRLAVNDENALVYVRRPAGPGPAQIKLFSLEDEEKKEQDVTTGGGFDITPDGKKLLVVSQAGAQIVPASAGAKGKPVSQSGMTVTIDPAVEWQQIFVEAWRLYKQYFYDPGLHGVDWDAVRAQYEPMLVSCVTREEVGYVIREMISELNVGHAYYRGGRSDGPRMSVGLLGCDFELHEGAFRIADILEGATWDLDGRGPLSQPGVDVSEGDYLLAVNGVPLDAALDPWAAFQGLAGQVTTLTVSAKATLDDEAREVRVKPLRSDNQLRYRAWIERNRRHVEEKSGGKIGYIYVPSTGIPGQNDLVRQYFGQVDKPALLIDERFNRGGQIPTRFIELLNRPVLHYFATRQGKPFKWPYDAHHGPKAMLINERAGSGGDAFPSYFRQTGLGKLIGKRTWGGLVGISGNPGFVDGTGVTVPTFGYYEKDGTWGIEGHGVPPDIEVEADPSLLVRGIDPQLDAGIKHLLQELENNPFVPVPKPKGPDRSGMGLADEDK